MLPAGLLLTSLGLGRWWPACIHRSRYSRDPFEGLEEQLTELIGLIKIVPRLIDADRGRRWDDIIERSAFGEPDLEPLGPRIEGERWPGEGRGHADTVTRS